METNSKKVLEFLVASLRQWTTEEGPVMDSFNVKVDVVHGAKSTTTVSKYVDIKGQNGEEHPIGMKVFTVTVEENYVPCATTQDDLSGFQFKGVWVTDPCLDETGRFAVKLRPIELQFMAQGRSGNLVEKSADLEDGVRQGEGEETNRDCHRYWGMKEVLAEQKIERQGSPH